MLSDLAGGLFLYDDLLTVFIIKYYIVCFILFNFINNPGDFKKKLSLLFYLLNLYCNCAFLI